MVEAAEILVNQPRQIDFATAGRIIFGAGKVAELPQIVSGLGKKAFLVRSQSAQAAHDLQVKGNCRLTDVQIVS